MIDVWCLRACVFARDMHKSCMFVERATELLCETFPAWFPVSSVKRNGIISEQTRQQRVVGILHWAIMSLLGLGCMQVCVCE